VAQRVGGLNNRLPGETALLIAEALALACRCARLADRLTRKDTVRQTPERQRDCSAFRDALRLS